MSHDEKLPRYAPRTLVSGTSAAAKQPGDVTPLAPRVQWKRAAALQIGAGAFVGFVVPAISFSGYGQDNAVYYHADPLTGVFQFIFLLVNAVFVGVIGGGIPLLAAWGGWRIVSRHRRSLLSEVLAVLLGAIGGGLVVSVPSLLILDWVGMPWPSYLVAVLVLGGIPGLAFAIWVASAWRRARQEAFN